MAKRKQNARKVLVMRDGTEFRVIGETGRYWICQGAQFKKNSKQIMRIAEERPAPVYEPEDARESGLIEED